MTSSSSAVSKPGRLRALARWLACAACLALPAAPAAAAAGPVEVVFPDRTVTLEAEQLAAAVDVVDMPYTLLAEDGGAPAVERLSGVSIRALVRLAQGNPDVVDGLTVSNGGGSVDLQGPDLATPPPFADGPPLVAVAGDTTSFVRPQRDLADVNAGDRLSAAGGQALRIELQAGASIDVSAGAEPTRVTPRGKVSFYALTLGADAAERVSFSWDFGDGTSGRGETVVHRYRRPGRYRAVVTVAGAGGSSGASAPVTISVGEPAHDARKRDGGAQSGAYDGASSGTAGGESAAGGSGDGGSAAGGSGGGGSESAAASTAEAGVAAEAKDAAQAASKPAEGSPQREQPRPVEQRQPGVERIVGQVLDTAGASGLTPLQAAAPAAGAVAEDDAGSLTFAVVGIAALALLAAGAFAESRGRRRSAAS